MLDSNLTQAIFLWCYMLYADNGCNLENFSIYSDVRIRIHSAVWLYALYVMGTLSLMAVSLSLTFEDIARLPITI
jgi:hypothetical protein